MKEIKTLIGGPSAGQIKKDSDDPTVYRAVTRTGNTSYVTHEYYRREIGIFDTVISCWVWSKALDPFAEIRSFIIGRLIGIYSETDKAKVLAILAKHQQQIAQAIEFITEEL